VSVDTHGLFELLPAILRIRDQARAAVSPGWLADPAQRATLAELQAKADAGTPLTPAEAEQLAQLQQSALAGPLASLLSMLAEQMALVQEDIEQLYDDQFIETCAGWAVPYIGDLIGYRMLRTEVPEIVSPRAEIAHTIAYRRRKGTVAVLEQLARDVTGWDAVAVEFFQRLIVTQYMNHLRPQCLGSPDLRAWEPLERLGSAFDPVMHTADVRRIASRRGRYNIPNVGLFLWPIEAWPLSASPAAQAAPGDARRWRFHPLNIDQQLFTLSQTEETITQRATPLNVPEPISRRVLDARLAQYYSGAGVTRSFCVYVDAGSGSPAPFDVSKIRVCNLSDQGGGWAHEPPAGVLAIDPVLGRLWLPPDAPAGAKVSVDFHYGFAAPLGGGEYPRAASFLSVDPQPAVLRVPDDYPTIAAALSALAGLAGDGVVEITDSGRYAENLAVAAGNGRRVELRAADGCRPTLVLGAELALTGGSDSEIRLNGLLITGSRLHVPAAGNGLARLRISHCTLVPGWTLAANCTPEHPDMPSLVAEPVGLALTVERSILGPLRTAAGESSSVALSDCILDATSTTRIAYAGLNDGDEGSALSLDACTVVGKLHARSLPLVTNSILLSALASGDSWTAPVIATRRQEGCVRFSYLPADARVPRRYRCLPESADAPELATARFATLRYGFPAYALLAPSSGPALLTGADDESQPGAFHFLYPPQRETNLRVRLDEYLRVGLEAGIFYETRGS
jgi:hypothetical protein